MRERFNSSIGSSYRVFCSLYGWLLPVLLIPKPLNPALWFNHSVFMGFYLLSFLLERKPCTICALVFLAALFLICYSCWGNCFLYHCQDSAMPHAGHHPAIGAT
ncbi:unnamed protein product [Boreogadus saida]